MMMASVPLGFRFMPTNEEVIKYYLSRRAMGLPVPSTPHIVEKQLYGENADPRRVLGDVDDSHWDIVQQEGSKSKDERVIYVLTKLTKTGKRVARRAGKGTWSGQTGGKDIRDSGSGQLIGTLKMFSYEADPAAAAGERNDGVHWIMHEYSLAGNNNNNIANNVKKDNGEYVICKIRRTSKRKEFCGQQQHDHDAPSPSFKKHKATAVSFDHHHPPPPPVFNNNHHHLVFTPQPTMNYDDQSCSTTPHTLAVDQEEESKNNNNIASVVGGVDDDKTQPADHHNVINLDDDACPNNVVGDGVNKLLLDGGSTRADPLHDDVINLEEGPMTGPDEQNKEEECTHGMERPSSSHNVVVAGTVEEGDHAVSTLVDSLRGADNNMMSLDDVEEPDLLDGLDVEFNLDDLDMYFTDCFMP